MDSNVYLINCYDYPKIPHIYKSDKINYKKLYGKGITYTNLLNQSSNYQILNETAVIENIKTKYYDIIIYGGCCSN